MLYAIYGIIQLLLSILMWVIIVQAILSWLVAFNVINTYNDFVRQLLYVLHRLTEPLYAPVRRILPDFGALDLSPMVVLLVLSIAQKFIVPLILLGGSAY